MSEKENSTYADITLLLVQSLTEVFKNARTFSFVMASMFFGWVIGSFYATLTFPRDLFSFRLEKPIERPSLSFAMLFAIPTILLTGVINFVGAMFFFRKDRRSPQVQEMYEKIDAIEKLRKQGKINAMIASQETNTIVRKFADEKAEVLKKLRATEVKIISENQ